MASWTSPAFAIPEVDPRHDFARADLEFLGVRHGGVSFQVHVFFDNPGADENTEHSAETGYGGTFTVFGHGVCFGDPGHCEVPEGPPDPFDVRLPHALTPANKTVTVTERVRAMIAAGKETLRVTLVSVPAADDYRGDPLVFDRLNLVTYE